ncbi:NAD(P)/FAD-dependent oxidoreductase [Gammaproteobacteria bacterium]|nr:NAD(P)/FAD-dependent oxidoreductase [Gammaproteobacteria bacterium]
MKTVDAIVIGAGAAGLMCAATAAQRGARVLLIDHAEKIGEKIRISGGGRCNFTNREVGADHFLSHNPHFARSALARYTPDDFLALLAKHRVSWHEKTLGQLFTDEGSQRIIDALIAECDAAHVERWNPTQVTTIEATDGRYRIRCDRGVVGCKSLVVASGGLSVPKTGASDFGYRIARQFGLKVIEPIPGLVPLKTDDNAAKALSGSSVEVVAECIDQRFREQMLFTHRGLSGPAILQISSYWQWQHYRGLATGDREPVTLQLLPDRDVDQWLQGERKRSNAHLPNLLAEALPARIARYLCDEQLLERPISELSNTAIATVAERLQRFTVMPSGTTGFAKAEVTLGGVDTAALSSKTLECRQHPNLHFIGEVVDVTGHLGGYNFQWAWASGHAAGETIATRT